MGRRYNSALVQYVTTTPDPRPENYVEVMSLLQDMDQDHADGPRDEDTWWWNIDVEGWSSAFVQDAGAPPAPPSIGELRRVGLHRTDMVLGIRRLNDFAFMDISAGMRISLLGPGISVGLYAPFDPARISGPAGERVPPRVIGEAISGDANYPGLPVVAGQQVTTSFVQADIRRSLAPLGQRLAQFTETRVITVGSPIADRSVPIRSRARKVECFVNVAGGTASPFIWTSGIAPFDRGEFDILNPANAPRNRRTGVVSIPGNADTLNIGSDTRTVTIVWHMEW